MVDYGGIAAIIMAGSTFVGTVGALWLRARNDKEDEDDEELLRQLRKEDRQHEINELLERRKNRQAHHKGHDDDSPHALLHLLHPRLARAT